MKSLVFLLALASSLTLSAQTSDTVFCRAVLLPANEVPAVNNTSRAVADVVASAVRDSTGQIVSGSIDFLVRATLPAAITATGLNLHSGAAGQNGAIAVSTGLSVANSRALQSGTDTLHFQVPVIATNTALLATLVSLFQDPTKFYLNLSASAQPNGLMRGPLARAQSVVLQAILTSDNVLPATADTATGLAQLVAIGTKDAAGNWTSGEVYLASTANSTDQSTINGVHIHFGAAGTIGAIALSATVPPGAAPDPTGFFVLGPLNTEITTTNTTQTGAFTNLFVNPTSLYLDLHTVQNPNGLLRAQLRPSDAMRFPLLLDSASELSPPYVRFQSPSAFTLYTLRNEDGSIAAGTLLSDLNLRFLEPQQFIGLFVHDGAPLTDGPVSIKAAPDFNSDTGFGNYYNWSPPITNLAAMNDLVQNPENHYVNLHSLSYPAGMVRAQFADPVRSPATVNAVIAGNLDKDATTLAPGSLISIFGANLAKVATDLSGWSGRQLPATLNGARVIVGGKPAVLLYVSPTQINAQLPADLSAGAQSLLVDNGNGPGAAFPITLAAAAPAIFFSPTPAVVKNSNFSLISAANPAKAGDILLVYATGLGQTSPALTTGTLVAASPLSQTAPVTATLGGKAATVVYSAASPGFAGLYQVAVTGPVGVTGAIPLQFTLGGAASNTVTINVQ